MWGGGAGLNSFVEGARHSHALGTHISNNTRSLASAPLSRTSTCSAHRGPSATTTGAPLGSLARASLRWPSLARSQPTDGKDWWSQDDQSVHLHNALWASAVSTAAGGAMRWWWHEFDQHGAYNHLAPVSRFVQRLPLLDRQWVYIPLPPIAGPGGPPRTRSCSIPPKPGHFPVGSGEVLDHAVTHTAGTCQQRCCNNSQCAGYVFTTSQIERDYPPCRLGGPCCWLKAGVSVIEPSPNCTAGLMVPPLAPGVWTVGAGVMVGAPRATGNIGGTDAHNDTVAVWLYNQAHTWGSQSDPAATAMVGPVNITLAGFEPGKSFTLTVVDPYTGSDAGDKRTVLASSNGQLALVIPKFSRDIAAIVAVSR